jgi:hypothetical protein
MNLAGEVPNLLPLKLKQLSLIGKLGFESLRLPGDGFEMEILPYQKSEECAESDAENGDAPHE